MPTITTPKTIKIEPSILKSFGCSPKTKIENNRTKTIGKDKKG